MRPHPARLSVAWLLCLPALAAAQPPPASQGRPAAAAGKVTYPITRAASAIKVDGVLDEDAWKTAAVVPLPIEWMPGDNVPPPVETECLVTYDAKNLYIAFRAHDPRPSEIRAHLMDRDDTDTLIQDDHVGMMIDTFNDERRAFQFRINPLGVQADAIFSEQDGVEDFSWDMILERRRPHHLRRLHRRNGAPAEATPLSVRLGPADVGVRGLPLVPAHRAPPHHLAAARPQQGVHPLRGEQDSQVSRGWRRAATWSSTRRGPSAARTNSRRPPTAG